MAILATKEEPRPGRPSRSKCPAEEVEKAFARSDAPTRSKAAIPGSGRGKAPEAVVCQAVRRGDQGRRAREPAARRAVVGRSRSGSSRSSAARTSRTSPGSRRVRFGFSRASTSSPRSIPGEYRGVPVEDVARRDRATRRSQGHRADPRSERRVPSGRGPGRGARRLRRGGHFRVVRRDPRAGPEPSNLPGREDDPRGRARRTPCRRSTRRSAARFPGRHADVPQDFPRGFSQRRVPRARPSTTRSPSRP